MAASPSALLAPLTIRLLPARGLRRAVAALHAALLTALACGAPHDAVSAGLALAAAASWLQCRRELDPAARGFAALACDSAGQWHIVERDGRRHSAMLADHPFVTTWLVILPLRLADRRRLRVLLTPGNTPPEALRRLRVRLRHRGAA